MIKSWWEVSKTIQSYENDESKVEKLGSIRKYEKGKEKGIVEMLDPNQYLKVYFDIEN